MFQSSYPLFDKFYSARVLFLLLGLVLGLSGCKKKDEPVTPTPPATPSPTISGFTPTSGAMGTVVVITGTHFSTSLAQNTVKFNGRPATLTAATATQLTVTVPEGAGDGVITVEVSGKNITSGAAFDYIETVTVTTIAGSDPGYADGTGTAARFHSPTGIAVDGSGNLYVVDHQNSRIRKITPTGVVTTLAGSTEGYADGTGAAARFHRPWGITIDGSGNLYVADLYNNCIRKVTPAGVVTTLAGSTEGYADGTGTAARFDLPHGVAVDGSGNLYVGDYGNFRIRKVTPAGVVSTIAGGRGYADGTGMAAKFDGPRGVALDGSGNLYMGDSENHRIRKVTPGGLVTTVAGSDRGYADGTGTAAQFSGPHGVAVNGSGNVYVVDQLNHRIRKVTPAGVVTTIAGSGALGYADGSGTAAQFYFPYDVAVDGLGNLYVAEGHRIRKVTIR